MKISATISSHFNHVQTTVCTNDKSKELEIQPKENGFGSGINGGELLMLSLATCFCNDLYREAARKNIPITSVEVNCSGTFANEGQAGTNITYDVKIDSPASANQIAELVDHTDKVAEIHNTLRHGAEITLVRS